MSLPVSQRALTYADYLAALEGLEYHAEFFEGALWMMSGGTPEHALLTMNCGVSLNLALRGRPCRVYSEALRIYFPSLDEAAYPDIKVICGEVEHQEEDRLAAVNPLLVVEVLSDSTEAFDRGEKFARYRTLPSLREYLLVDQHTRRLERFSRDEEGRWAYAVAEAGEQLALPALGVEIAVDEIYEGVVLLPRTRPEPRGDR